MTTFIGGALLFGEFLFRSEYGVLDIFAIGELLKLLIGNFFFFLDETLFNNEGIMYQIRTLATL